LGGNFKLTTLRIFGVSPLNVLRTAVRRSIRVPSGGVTVGRSRRVRLLGLIAVRNEMRFLPGCLANVAPHVDGILALDDGSTDGSAELLDSHPAVLELIRRPPDRPFWDEVGNFRLLHEAALRHHAEWILWIDADERVERQFRDRAERVIRRGERLGLVAYAVRLRELWGSPETYRADGVWGRKRQVRVFRAMPDHVFDARPLHATRGPLQGRVLGGFPYADLTIFHLRMIRPEDRAARRDRYRGMDPQALYQPGIGYDYLTDERGLELSTVSKRRGFSEPGPDAPFGTGRMVDRERHEFAE
jgi:glycosyltransferase involved in cell wall biosynthesis